MDKRFIFFLVFVSVTQNSVLPSSAVFTGFPKDTVTLLDAIADRYVVARRGTINGLNTIFSKMVEYITETSHEAENVTTQFFDGINQVKQAFILTINSTTVFGGDNFSNLSLKLLDNTFAPIIRTIELVTKGQNKANERKITDNQFKTLSNSEGVLNVLFTVIQNYTYVNTRNAEQLIDQVWINTTDDLSGVWNATYAAMRLLDPTASAKQMTTALEPHRKIAVAGLVAASHKIFSLYEALFIDNFLGHSNVINQIYGIRYSRKILAYTMAEAVTANFDSIVTTFSDYTNNASQGRFTFAVANASEFTDDIVPAKIQEAGRVFLESVKWTQPNSVTNVTVTEAVLPKILNLTASRMLAALSFGRVGTNKCPTQPTALNAIEKIQNEESEFISNILFAVLRNNRTIQADLEPTISALEQDAVNNIKASNTYTLRAVRFTNKIYCIGEGTCADGILEILNYRTTAADAAARAAILLSYANLIEVIADAGY